MASRQILEKRAYVHQHLSIHPCVDCGEKDIVVLEFDHVRGIKEYSINRMLNHNGSLECMIIEIEKCDVRCANCHRRKTHRDFGSYRLSANGVLQLELDTMKSFPKMSKISFETAQAIRLDYKPYEFGFKRLAKKYGISSAAIRAILRNETHTTAPIAIKVEESDSWFV